MPFVEALSYMLKYAKFIKDLLTKKWKFKEVSTMILSEGSSILLQNQMPKKMKDLKCFTIYCNIGELMNEQTLEDLREC